MSLYHFVTHIVELLSVVGLLSVIAYGMFAINKSVNLLKKLVDDVKEVVECLSEWRDQTSTYNDNIAKIEKLNIAGNKEIELNKTVNNNSK